MTIRAAAAVTVLEAAVLQVAVLRAAGPAARVAEQEAVPALLVVERGAAVVGAPAVREEWGAGKNSSEVI